MCREYAKRNGLIVVNECIDRAITGKNDKRPALQQMLYDDRIKLSTYTNIFPVKISEELFNEVNERLIKSKRTSAHHKTEVNYITRSTNN